MAYCISLQRGLCISSISRHLRVKEQQHRHLMHSLAPLTSSLAVSKTDRTSMSAMVLNQSGGECAALDVRYPSTSCAHQCMGPAKAQANHTITPSSCKVAYQTYQNSLSIQTRSLTVEAPTQAASSSSHPTPSYMSHTAWTPERKREVVCSCLDAALTKHNSELQSCFPAGTPLELLRSAHLCIELAKQQASSHLKAHTPLKDCFVVRPIKEQLAAGILGKVNVWNGVPELRWTGLSPAVMVPLMESFIDSGYADEFGLPVFRQQDPQPRLMGLEEFLAFKVNEPDFVGSEEEVFCDDAMWVYPAKAPVVGTNKLGELMTQPAFLEQVLTGYPAGRQLLDSIRTACAEIGLLWGGRAGASVSAESGQWASVFDLVARRPLAVLGALFLSQPEMPFAVFLRAVAAAGAGGAAAGVLGQVPAGLQLLRRLQDGWEALVCAGAGGGPVWGWGQLTAVGAGEDGSRGVARIMVPVYQRRQQGVVGGGARKR